MELRRVTKIFIVGLICLLSAGRVAFAQQTDTSNNLIIHILNNKLLTFTKTDSGDFFRFIGDVIMQQGTDTLYCDSLYQNKTTNILEAFSHVRIAQIDGTQGLCDYLRYTTAQKLAYMRGNVSLTDGKNKLWAEELTYNLGTKIGVYDNHGTLQADSTLVTSQRGVYNVKTKEARFGGHVIVTDPTYYTQSEDMGYNTETKATRFYSRSIVTGDSNKTILQTSNGSYDSHTGLADLYDHSSVWYDGFYLEGDTIHYNKVTGYGYAYGNVIGIDTGHHSTLYCGRATYNKRKRILWAVDKPVLEQVNGKDTLYMRADTFYSAPIVKVPFKEKGLKRGTQAANSVGAEQGKGSDSALSVATQVTARKKGFNDPKLMPDSVKAKIADSVAALPPIMKNNLQVLAKEPDSVALAIPRDASDTWTKDRIAGQDSNLKPSDIVAAPPPNKKDRKKHKQPLTAPQIVVDTADADTSAPLYFTGYHHVRIFSDSMQGVCDSIIYTQDDSTIRMVYNPILWSRNSQVTGDTILMLLDSSRIKSVYVPNNAFVVSLAGPPKAGLYDQVQGKTLRGFFRNNTINRLIVTPNAEAIYYPKDDSGAFIGASQANSERMKIFFEDQKIKSIKFERDVHQSLTPLEKADIPNLKLSRFKWLVDKRPRTKEELFD